MLTTRRLPGWLTDTVVTHDNALLMIGVEFEEGESQINMDIETPG